MEKREVNIEGKKKVKPLKKKKQKAKKKRVIDLNKREKRDWGFGGLNWMNDYEL